MHRPRCTHLCISLLFFLLYGLTSANVGLIQSRSHPPVEKSASALTRRTDDAAVKEFFLQWKHDDGKVLVWKWVDPSMKPKKTDPLRCTTKQGYNAGVVFTTYNHTDGRFVATLLRTEGKQRTLRIPIIGIGTRHKEVTIPPPFVLTDSDFKRWQKDEVDLYWMGISGLDDRIGAVYQRAADEAVKAWEKAWLSKERKCFSFAHAMVTAAKVSHGEASKKIKLGPGTA